MLSHGSVTASHLSPALRGLKQKRKRMRLAGRPVPGAAPATSSGTVRHLPARRRGVGAAASPGAGGREWGRASDHGPGAALWLQAQRPPRPAAVAAAAPAGDAG